LIAGRASLNGRSCNFAVASTITPLERTIEPVPSRSGSVPSVNPTTAFYPPRPALQTRLELNEKTLRPPQGPPRDFSVMPSPISIREAPIAAAGALPLSSAEAAPGTTTVARNAFGGRTGSVPPDPSVSGVTPAGVVILSANVGVGYSTDDGQTFTIINLFNVADPLNPARKTFFPEDDGGLCCDQVVIYVPKQDLFVWLSTYAAKPIVLNGQNTTGPNRLRIAWAKPADVAADFLHAWSYTDLTSASVGLGNDWLDYPDLAFSDNFLYIAADHGLQGTGQVYSFARILARLSLSDMANNAGVIHYDFMEPKRLGLAKTHLAQSSPDAMVWAGQFDSSTLTVYVWADVAAEPRAEDVAITSYNPGDLSIFGPDGVDWNTSTSHGILGAVRTHFRDPACTGRDCDIRFVYFAFEAGRDPDHGRPFPYIRVEKIDIMRMTLVGELDLFNVGFGCASPALVSRLEPNSDREVAATFACSPDGGFAQNAVGFLGDVEFKRTTDSSATQPGRFGDYFHVRNSVSPPSANGRGLGFSTLSYSVVAKTPGVSCTTGGCTAELRYVLFGRDGELAGAAHLTVNKVVLPATDTGRFNLLVDGAVQAANVRDGGSTGALTVGQGVHRVSETAAAGTSLGDYDVFIGGDCAANGTVTLAAGEDKTCTIVNTAASQCAADCKKTRDDCIAQDPSDTKLCVAEFIGCMKACP